MIPCVTNIDPYVYWMDRTLKNSWGIYRELVSWSVEFTRPDEFNKKVHLFYWNTGTAEPDIFKYAMPRLRP